MFDYARHERCNELLTRDFSLAAHGMLTIADLLVRISVPHSGNNNVVRDVEVYSATCFSV